MPLSIEEVEHIAMLARLELSAEEKNRYRQQLSAIIIHVHTRSRLACFAQNRQLLKILG